MSFVHVRRSKPLQLTERHFYPLSVSKSCLFAFYIHAFYVWSSCKLGQTRRWTFWNEQLREEAELFLNGLQFSSTWRGSVRGWINHGRRLQWDPFIIEQSSRNDILCFLPNVVLPSSPASGLVGNLRYVTHSNVEPSFAWFLSNVGSVDDHKLLYYASIRAIMEKASMCLAMADDSQDYC